MFTSQNDDSFLNADIALNNFHYSAISSSSLNFINKYTVQASKDLQFANPANPKYLILGECITASPAAPEQSVLFDIRKPGGGLKDQPDLLEELVETVPEIQWITDDGFIDGLPYPGTAAFICEIPTYLQNEFGGNFTDIAIRQIIERHMVAGGYPITRGYSTDILFSVEPMIDGSLNISFLLKWRTYGNKKYNIYYSAFKEHDFEKSNSTPIIDNSAGNTYTITGTFVPNKVYWFYIVETDGVLDLPQSIIGPTDKLTYQNLNKVGIKTYLNPI